MNSYVTGTMIKELREKKKMTQAMLGEQLGVTDKTISKWETGKGYPDISLLEPLAKAFQISLTELVVGNTVSNANVSANMLRTKFYICPICGNVIHAVGEAVIQCHGITLAPAEAENTDEEHTVSVERIEGDYFIEIKHDMTKQHYISFVAAVSSDGMQMIKLYPEGDPQVRVNCRGVSKIYYYCNKHGLFSFTIKGKRNEAFDQRKNFMETE